MRYNLIDFVSTQPEVLSQVATKRNIQHGFLENGLVCKLSKEFPDYSKLLATCKKNPSEDVWKRTLKAFLKLFAHQLQHGHLTDDILEQCGLPEDLDNNNQPVPCNATISQESWQRAKCLTHKHQKHFQELLRKEIDDANKKSLVNEANKIGKILESNRLCKEKLASMQIVDYNTATMQDFNKCTVDLLTGFIIARTPEILDTGKLKMPKKGNIEMANNGEDCLILKAYSVRSHTVALKIPVIDLDERSDRNDRTDEEDTQAMRNSVVNVCPMDGDMDTTGTNDSMSCASDFLKIKDWMVVVLSLFGKFENRNEITERTEKIFEDPNYHSTADELHKLLKKDSKDTTLYSGLMTS